MKITYPQRNSYQANILLVPLGTSGEDLVRKMGQHGLTGVRVVTDAGSAVVDVRDMNHSHAATQSIGSLVNDSDMVILVGARLPEVPIGFASTMAEAARESGNLLAGILIDQSDWESSAGAEAMAVLRMELDMLVSVTQVSLATAFIDVLKGGFRSEGEYAPKLVVGSN